MEKNTPEQNTYLLDAESPAEMARLTHLDRITTQAMKGPLTGIPDPSRLRNVLDLGCGPGSWVLDVAFALPNAEIEGVDISRMMVDYANARARTQRLLNASFGVMNITQPLDFPDAAFDLVNARFLVGVLRREAWPALLAECFRVLRPGGLLRLTEPIDSGVTSSPAYERMQGFLFQAMQRGGYGFSTDGRTYGITHVLPFLMREAGYQAMESFGHLMECSADTDGWQDFYHNVEIGHKLGQPFYIKTGVATQEELDQLYQQVLIEMHAKDFRGVWHYATFQGNKPAR